MASSLLEWLVEIYGKIYVGIVSFVDVKAKPFVQGLRGGFFISLYNNPFDSGVGAGAAFDYRGAVSPQAYGGVFRPMEQRTR